MVQSNEKNEDQLMTKRISELQEWLKSQPQLPQNICSYCQVGQIAKTHFSLQPSRAPKEMQIILRIY
ncbi:hypothetical protein M5D96_013223 [Drosophila gunungcola]|uniref:Uncharacterized protein n=1 Tax=Drosophila gunungcola TaxID=103775 RepID=A0A9P9YBM5_9MUSC|nr:hypothetical protein M5D96_013223 [Drosophila gunungcola]